MTGAGSPARSISSSRVSQRAVMPPCCGFPENAARHDGADRRGRRPRDLSGHGTGLVTVLDHGLNASTFTARVVASTRAGMVSSIVAALCALEGPLHGGAPG